MTAVNHIQRRDRDRLWGAVVQPAPVGRQRHADFAFGQEPVQSPSDHVATRREWVKASIPWHWLADESNACLFVSVPSASEDAAALLSEFVVSLLNHKLLSVRFDHVDRNLLVRSAKHDPSLSRGRSAMGPAARKVAGLWANHAHIDAATASLATWLTSSLSHDAPSALARQWRVVAQRAEEAWSPPAARDADPLLLTEPPWCARIRTALATEKPGMEEIAAQVAQGAADDACRLAVREQVRMADTIDFSEEGLLSLEWKSDRGGVLLVFSGDGEASYSAKEAGELYVSIAHFGVDSGLPAKARDALDGLLLP